MIELSELLAANPYPGRGVLCARTRGGAYVGGYFLTGRSAASRDRVLRVEKDELLVGPAAVSGHDPLRHYAAATLTPEWLVLGNGEQVSQVAERLLAGAAPAVALDGLEYEPDPPIRTSRITALLSRLDPFGDVTVLGAARPSAGARLTSNVTTLTVRGLEPGEGVLLTTYRSDGTDVAVAAPFDEVSVTAEDGPELLDQLWSALRPEYRVAAAVLDPTSGPASTISQPQSLGPEARGGLALQGQPPTRSRTDARSVPGHSVAPQTSASCSRPPLPRAGPAPDSATGSGSAVRTRPVRGRSGSRRLTSTVASSS